MNSLNKYEKVRDLMKTGDVIAFQGNDACAKAIQVGTKSKYSHVGLVVRIKDLAIDRVFIAESIVTAGVVLVPLSRKLEGCSGCAWFFPLKMDISKLPEYVDENTIRKFFYEWTMSELGKKYDFKLIGAIIRQILARQKISKEDQQEYICSEFVATAYKKAGILPKKLSTSLTPKDICDLTVLGAPIGLR